MRASSPGWDRAAVSAFEIFEAALRDGAISSAATALAVACARAQLPWMNESDVREALAAKLAEKRLAARTGPAARIGFYDS